jgi:hypothetical protein
VDSPDPASKSGQTDRLVGYSPAARMVIVVIYLRDRLIGVNARKAAGIPAAGLVRGWVLQGLAAEREGSVEQTVEALSRDVARLRRQLTERRHHDRVLRVTRYERRTSLLMDMERSDEADRNP